MLYGKEVINLPFGLFCFSVHFSAGLQSAFASNSLSKEREKCENYQQCHAKMVKNTSV